MSTAAVRRLAIVGEVLAAATTLWSVALVVSGPDPADLPGRLLVSGALCLGLVPILLELASYRRQRFVDPLRPAVPPATPDRGTVTTVIRLGCEPVDVARTSILLAAQAGPVAVITTRGDLAPEIERLRVSLHRGRTIEEALVDAARCVTTDFLLVVSARAVPCLEACESAAALVTGRVGWATGRTDALNDDAFVEDRREIVNRHLRSRARGFGLVLWEPEATLVRADLVRGFAFEPGRPWGRWLRQRCSAGYVGIDVDEVFSLRVSPVAAEGFWPDTTARQRASAADLGDAIGSGPVVARLVAAALIARELYAYSLAIWLAVGSSMVSSGAADRTRTLSVVAVVSVAALVGWAALRTALGVELRPVADLVAAVHGIPGSFAALLSAVNRRVRRTRRPMPDRPLVWAALIVTVVAGGGLLGQSVGERVSVLRAVAALSALGLLWVFAIRALVQRTWQRSTFRLRLDLAVTVDGCPARTVDASPTGLSVRGEISPSARIGARAKVSLDFDDGVVLRTHAVITGRRSGRSGESFGLALELDDRSRAIWLARLLRARRDGEFRAPRSRTLLCNSGERGPVTDRVAARRGDQLATVLASAASVAVIAALVLVMAGYSLRVIRSGSMEPTLGVGDIVVSEPIRASALRPGDIVTVPYLGAIGESLTHRLRAVDPDAGALRFTTRGDANRFDETWSASPDTALGRAAWSVPWIGSPAILLRGGVMQILGLAAAAALAAVPVLRSTLRRDRPIPL